MDFENFNQKIGGCGLYHWILFFLLSITTFKCAEDFQGLTFALYEPKFKCDPRINSRGNISSYIISDNQCQYRPTQNESWIPCSTWIYDTEYLKSTFVTQFDMVCDKAYYRDLMFTIFFAGGLVSYLLVILSDSIGRRLMFIVCIYLSVVVTICQVFTNSLPVHFALAFLSNSLMTIYISLSYTTLIELIPVNRLDFAASQFWNLYGIGYMSTALFGYIGRSWQIIYISSLLFSIFYLLYPCFIFETPRWLMLKQKRNESFKVFSIIAKINRCSFMKEDFNNWNPVQQKTGRFWNLFKYKAMIYRLLILNFAAWSFSFAYIGSATDLTFASSNIFVTTLVMGSIELPTGPLAGLLANRLGRKKSILLLSGMGILCLLVLPFIESDISKSNWQPWFKMALAMGGKLGFTSSWIVFDILTNELVPTSDRNAAVSIVYTAVGLGSLIAPSIHNAAQNLHYAAPCLMYSAILSVTVILVRLFLPETHHLPVPQTIEQAVSLVINEELIWKEKMIEEAAKSQGTVVMETLT